MVDIIIDDIEISCDTCFSEHNSILKTPCIFCITHNKWKPKNELINK